MSISGRLFGMALLFMAISSGCATGRPLSLSGGLLPPGRDLPAGKALSRVAVVDFEFAGGEDAVIGRDYDNVRPIVWKGSPGAAVADIVATYLVDQGVSVIRVPTAGQVPGGVLVTVRGRIDDFRANAKRIHSVKVESTAHVGGTVFAEGERVPPGWSAGPFSSDVWATEPFFVTPDGVRDAIASAANGVADELAQRLMTLRNAFSPAGAGPL